MEFDLTIEFNSTVYKFAVQQSKPVKGFERFTLTGGDRTVVLQSNRPMLQARGLKKKPITWKVLEGEVKSERALELAKKAIEKRLSNQQIQSEKAKNSSQMKPPSKTIFAKTSRQKAREQPPAIPWNERVK